ncbi:hypothetical protein BHM03_00060681 [Ensete ventricosum]|nr:hypothetical protein BHM03_00060681 [Ensete ventricosum]
MRRIIRAGLEDLGWLGWDVELCSVVTPQVGKLTELTLVLGFRPPAARWSHRFPCPLPYRLSYAVPRSTTPGIVGGNSRSMDGMGLGNEKSAEEIRQLSQSLLVYISSFQLVKAHENLRLCDLFPFIFYTAKIPR